jgi:hypothetical protein
MAYPKFNQFQFFEYQPPKPIHHRLARLLIGIVLTDPLVVGEGFQQGG